MKFEEETIQSSRRNFLKITGLAAGLTLAAGALPFDVLSIERKKILVGAHLWLYASKYPAPEYDCYNDLEQVFADLSYAGYDGVELMHAQLKHDDTVQRIGDLKERYQFGVIGSSYAYNKKPFWDTNAHAEILEDVELITGRLKQLNAKTFGISVGDPGNHIKTEQELDNQAAVLEKIIKICKKMNLVANLHNHTYEVKDDMHDLKGTIKRIPSVKLGPDLNWLIRGGVDPVKFIETYGHQIVYLHLRNQDKDGVWTETLGEGVTDFDAINTALKKVAFSGIATVELAYPKDFKPTRPLKENWKLSREFVKQKFGW